jgi:hypothetical protein
MNIRILINKITFMSTLSNIVETISDYIQYFIESAFYTNETFDYIFHCDNRHTNEYLPLYAMPAEIDTTEIDTIYTLDNMDCTLREMFPVFFNNFMNPTDEQ